MQTTQWSDLNRDQGLQDDTQIEGQSQTPEDKTCPTFSYHSTARSQKKTDDPTQTARRSRRFMDKRSGEYKSPQERALQVCIQTLSEATQQIEVKATLMLNSR
jgi:hypothetical protein